MSFENPIWLAITPLLALLSIGLTLLGWRKRSHLLAQFAAARLLDRLTEKASAKRRLLKSALIVAAVSLLGLALARPQYGVEWSERKARGLDIVFALDSSRSMLATDLRPTRLERGKLAILDLIDRLESDRIGLVAFAGQAFLQTPPTLDYGAFRESLNATDPSILSRGGSDLGRAIEEAAKAFPTENNVKIAVLLTDGEDLGGQALEAARAAAGDGIQIFTIGVGTPQGEYLRTRNQQGIETFVRDNNDQPVRSQLDESTLQQIAQITGGSYTRLGGGSLEALYDSVLSTLPREERESELQEVSIERFQWLLAAALTFLILEILVRSRRPRVSQASLLLLLSLGMVSPNPAEASPYNEAHAALTEGDYGKANQLYTEAMKQTGDRSLQRDALYNMGHATYQIGRKSYDQGDAEAALEKIRSAEELFGAALELDPGDTAVRQELERTQKVREAIERVLEQLKEQEQQENQPDQQDSDQSGEQEDSENQNSESQDQQGSEQQDEQNQQQKGESGQQQQDQENQSGQQQEQNQPGESGEEQSGESKESDQKTEPQSGQEEPSEEQSGQAENGENDPEESEDQETAAGEETDASEEQTGESTGPVPQVGEQGEGETDGEASGAAQASNAVQVEGMTLNEAQDLLDSLRGKEEILPFAKPAPGKGRPLQDW